MHYRISVYNYFAGRFSELGYRLLVRADELQRGHGIPVGFDFKEIPFRFSLYRQEIARIEPDVVILFLHLKDLIIFPLLHWLRLKKIPVLFWTKGANLDRPDSRWRIALFHHVHNRADGLLLYSRHELPFIRPRNRPKVTFANNTINHYDFPRIEETKEDIRKSFNLPFRKIALFVGRMGFGGGRKKADHAIDLFKTIDNPDYGLVLVGSGLNEELRRSMNKRNTVYLGEIHDPQNFQISRIFKMSDVFLMPGHVGLGLNQAFFWGLPVVTEAGRQPPEIHYLVDGRNGYIVEENNTSALREKLLFLLENDGERLRLGANARRDFFDQASIDLMFKGFLDNIERVCQTCADKPSG